MDKSCNCTQLEFGLIVTGIGEGHFLPLLFRSLRDCGPFRFCVIRRIGQRHPISAPDRKLYMVGSGKLIPTRDQEEIGLPARQWLQRNECRFVIVVDDLEYERHEQAQAVFERYRAALDIILRSDEQRRKASVHFLVMMQEAYFFADASAINHVLALQPPLQDFADDVETIRHPKNKLKRLKPGYDEKSDGEQIMARLDVEHVLSKTNACAALRTLFVWCIEAILEYYPTLSNPLPECRIDDGIQYAVTQSQLTVFKQ